MKAASKPLKLRNDLGSGRQTPPNSQARSTPNRNEYLDSRSKGSSSPVSSPARGSSEASRLASLASVTRKGSSMTKRFGSGHDRKDSVLSVSSRGAKSDADEVGRSRSPQDDEDEFDALVRSGETMKVSLTPSRLKTFEVSNGAPWRRFYLTTGSRQWEEGSSKLPLYEPVRETPDKRLQCDGSGPADTTKRSWLTIGIP
jgi:hypothetical protein